MIEGQHTVDMDTIIHITTGIAIIHITDTAGEIVILVIIVAGIVLIIIWIAIITIVIKHQSKVWACSHFAQIKVEQPGQFRSQID